MKKHIVDTITLTSLSLAVLSIIESCNFNFLISSFLILSCFILDALDGTIARYFKVDSTQGKHLDSLSDMTAFGIAPGILMYNFIYYEFNTTLAYLALLIPICTAIRIANYNDETKEMEHFQGLASPASALLFLSIPIIQVFEKNNMIIKLINNAVVISILIIFTSILLIMKFKSFHLRIDKFQNNKRKLFFIFFSISILFIFKYTGIPIVILSYVILSITKTIN